MDFRNNVIYNWATNNVYAGEGGRYNILNNYYKPGPSTKSSVKSRIANPYKNEKFAYGKYFINGNYMDGDPKITDQNWFGVTMDKGTPPIIFINCSIPGFHAGSDDMIKKLD